MPAHLRLPKYPTSEQPRTTVFIIGSNPRDPKVCLGFTLTAQGSPKRKQSRPIAELRPITVCNRAP